MRSRALRAALSLLTAVLAVTGALRALPGHSMSPGPHQVSVAAASPPVLLAVPLGPPAPPTTTTVASTTTTVARHFAPEVSRSAPLPTESQGVQMGANYSASYSTACYPAVGMAPRNGTEACISSREHGGCYDASANPSHAGRWQMTESLFYSVNAWPRDAAGHVDYKAAWSGWRYASPGTQDVTFRTLVERDHGYGNWTPYDRC